MSLVDKGAGIACGTRVWAGAHIMRGTEVGQDRNIGEHCLIENGVRLGNHVP